MANRALNAALFGALALGMAITPADASADTRPVVGACREITDPSLMRDTGQPLSLTVEKTKGNQYSDASLPLGSVEGIEFKLYKLRGLSLSTPSGLSAAKHLTVNDARSNGLDFIASQRTDANGATQFTGLAPAMYLVEEVAPADPAHDYRTSDPFLVLMPTIKADCENRNLDTVVVVKSHSHTSTTPTVPTLPPDSPPVTITTVTTPPGQPPITITTTEGVPGIPGTPGTETVTTTAPGTPGTPGAPGTPGTPGRPNNPGDPDQPANPPKRERPDGPLASTGASVLWLLVVALALISGGALLARNRKTETT